MLQIDFSKWASTIPINVRKRFVKDNNLPIPVLDDPYFEYFINLYQKDFNTVNLILNLNDCAANTNSWENFFQESKTIMDSVIDAVSSTEAYGEFLSMDMDAYKPIQQINHSKLYKQTNANKQFVSIDLKKANFQALKYYDSELVFNCDFYEELLEIVSDDVHDYYMKSKQIRQVIFGNLNPKRQQTIQKYMISLILNVLYENGFSEEQIFSSSPDEIIVESNDVDGISNIIEQSNDCNNMHLHIDSFVLKQIHENYSYFVKEYENGSVEFKGVPQNNMAEFYKYYYGMDINNYYDLVFVLDGRIAHFDKPLIT